MTVVARTWLFKKDSKGRCRVWRAWEEDGSYCSDSGVDGGIIKTTKNLQVATATMTREEHAKSKVASQYASKMKKGYFTSREEALAHNSKKPMLLHRYEENMEKISFPCFVMPKLDGVCATFEVGKCRLMSREYNEFVKIKGLAKGIASHIDMGGDYPVTDSHGELYAHGYKVSEIIEAIKGDNVEVLSKLKFYIFDYMPEDLKKYKYLDRLRVGSKVYQWDKPNEFFSPVKMLIAQDKKDIDAAHLAFIEQGFEGTVVCNIHGEYRYDTRSYDKLKKKQLFSKEFLIKGIQFEHVGSQKLILFRCAADNGKLFSVSPAWSNAVRAEAYEKPNEMFLGKKLTVEYRSLTKYGIPFHPVGKAVRDYE